MRVPDDDRPLDRGRRYKRDIRFRTAHTILAKLGIEKTAPQRPRAGISFALQTATDKGHCGQPILAAW